MLDETDLSASVKARSVIAAWAVLVVDVDRDLLAQRSTDTELHGLRIAHEIGHDVHLHTFGANDPVRSKVLSLEMGVDRHLELGSTSTDGWDEIDRSDTTPLGDQLRGLGGDEQLHNTGPLSSGFLSATRYKK